jgi:hypothetical protein
MKREEKRKHAGCVSYRIVSYRIDNYIKWNSNVMVSWGYLKQLIKQGTKIHNINLILGTKLKKPYMSALGPTRSNCSK